MVYTAEIKETMDGILAAFGDYIQEQSRFAIRYTEKLGYIWISAQKPGDQELLLLDTPDKLLEALMENMADDILAKRSPLREDADWAEEVKTEVYRRIMEGVKKIKNDRAHYVHLAINYYQDRFERRQDDRGYNDTYHTRRRQSMEEASEHLILENMEALQELSQ